MVSAKLRQTKVTNLWAAQDVLARLHNWETEMIEEALCIFFISIGVKNNNLEIPLFKLP